jgi:hypothetical protein
MNEWTVTCSALVTAQKKKTCNSLGSVEVGAAFACCTHTKEPM